LAQLERIDEFVQRKRRMGARYSALLNGLPGVQLPLARTDYAENIYWVYGLVLDDALGFDAEEAMRRLAAEGIGTRPFFCPMHQQPVLKRMGLFENESYPVAERMYRQGFYIPSGMALSDEQIEQSASAVKQVLI
jgi:perosamine synthetase